MKERTVKKALRKMEPVVLVALPIVMLACAWLNVPGAAMVTSVCAVIALVPFFASFEMTHLSARDLMPIVVMTALAVAGRLIFAPVPAIKPVTAIVVIAGLCFGREEGFLTGALTMLVSNIFFGQGPWTPWQMFGMGLIGYLTGFFTNLANGIGTVVFLVPIAESWPKMFGRIKEKYRIGAMGN